MNLDEIEFHNYIPTYERYFDEDLRDPSILKYVSFPKREATLIFHKQDLVGCYKTMVWDEQRNDREIWIAILPKYRHKGIASYVIKTLIHNIFSNDLTCPEIHLSIDQDNLSSIQMAHACGFFEDNHLEQELRENGDNRTKIFTIQNDIHSTKEPPKKYIHK